MGRAGNEAASLSADGEGRMRLAGALGFTTVSALLPQGEQAILESQVRVMDLSGVTSSDSAGLALLIEWQSIARAVSRTLIYEHLPESLLQLARLSDVEGLLVGTPP